MEYYMAVNKKEILPFVTVWMDPERFWISNSTRVELV